jgi:F420H(2)-dependent quinone reductase
MTTTTHTKRPRSREREARLMRLVNIPMRRILALPFATPPGKRLMLLRLTGRKTGKIYKQPVSFIRQGDALLTPGGGRWTLNLVEGQAVPVRLRGRDVLARPELISDPEQVQRMLSLMIKDNPAVAKFVRIPQDEHGRFDSVQLATAIKYGFRIVRWHLDPGDLPS